MSREYVAQSKLRDCHVECRIRFSYSIIASARDFMWTSTDGDLRLGLQADWRSDSGLS